jgi:hypothetical protein
MTNKTENNNLISSSSVEEGGEQTTNKYPNFDRKLDQSQQVLDLT